MNKDFAQSYDQRKWEMACESHNRYSKILNDTSGDYRNEKFLSYIKEQKTKIEMTYPNYFKGEER